MIVTTDVNLFNQAGQPATPFHNLDLTMKVE